MYINTLVKKETEVLSERTRGNEQKLKYIQFCLEIRKKYPSYTAKVIKH